MRQTILRVASFAPVLVLSFSVNRRHKRPTFDPFLAATESNDEQPSLLPPTDPDASDWNTFHPRRRSFLTSSLAACTTVIAAEASGRPAAWAMESPVSLRPTVYAVDATIPPTLRPVPKASQQQSLLTNLGRGLGTAKTRKTPINLNNILNRVVFGTVEAIQTLAVDTSSPASFVCMGVSNENSSDSIQLGLALTDSIVQGAQGSKQQVAIGLSTLPISAQAAVDSFVNGQSDWDTLVATTKDTSLEPYRSLLEYARQQRISILAMALDATDASTVLSKGLQALDPELRQQYVADPTGFIAQTTDPQFGLYTDRVLLRDVAEEIDLDANDAEEDAPPQPKQTSNSKSNDNNKNLFAERILAHEAAATVLARFASSHSKSVVLCFAPVDDLRYMKGINGRLPRIYNALASTGTTTDDRTISDDDVTTILLQPSPKDTLSETRRLRLEVGTGPDTIQYQMKVADYIWFRSNPPVYLLPRVMDYKF